MKKIQYILFLSIATFFVACKKEVILPNNNSTENNVVNQTSSSRSMSISSDGTEILVNDETTFDTEGNTIVDPTGRPKPSRPGSGGSK
jgi:hypothetical protein